LAGRSNEAAVCDVCDVQVIERLKGLGDSGEIAAMDSRTNGCCSIM